MLCCVARNYRGVGYSSADWCVLARMGMFLARMWQLKGLEVFVVGANGFCCRFLRSVLNNSLILNIIFS